jgi:hypothetical protein
MKLVTIDGKKIIEINHVDANLKMAVIAETNGDTDKAWRHFARALTAESDRESHETSLHRLRHSP